MKNTNMQYWPSNEFHYHYIAAVKIVHSCRIGITENCKSTEMLIMFLLGADLQEDRSYRQESWNYRATDS